MLVQTVFGSIPLIPLPKILEGSQHSPARPSRFPILEGPYSTPPLDIEGTAIGPVYQGWP